ncbi:MAG: tetratricopeptide repeat protein [Planctomycetales bacterium]|jgi:tetratricopeptide (TPR) repeat protein
MPDDFRDGAEPEELSPAPGLKRFTGVGIIGVLVVTLVVCVVVWSNSFRRKPPDWEAISQAQELGDFEGSIDLCVQLAELDRDQAAEALAFAGETAMSQLAQFSRGEELILSALEHNPSNRRALGSYSRLLTMSGQRWKSTRWLAQYVVRFDDSLQQLIWLSDASVVITDWDLLKVARQSFPNDPLPALGLAFDALVDRPKDAVGELKECLRISPEMVEANALLGRALLDSGDEVAYQNWDRGLSAEFEIHPEVWRARGMWWRDHDPGKALRCYLECCRRAPDDAETNLQISLLLIQVGEMEAATVFRTRFEMINAYLDLVRAVRERNDLTLAIEAADLAEQLQRPAESIGWRRVAAQQRGRESGTQGLDVDVDSEPAVASTFDPDNVVDRLRWPVPGPAEISRESASVVQQSVGNIRFRNVADTIGLTSRTADGSRRWNRFTGLTEAALASLITTSTVGRTCSCLRESRLPFPLTQSSEVRCFATSMVSARRMFQSML